MNNKMKGIIFDLDGVIVHTDKFHYMAWKKLADRLGIYFNEKINNRCRGVSRRASLEIVLGDYAMSYSNGDKTALAEEKNEYYCEYLLTMTPDDVTKEILDTLGKLRKNGYKLAIGSSSRNAKTILQQVGLFDFFDAVSDGENITHSKPHPEVFLKAAEYLQLKPEECFVVEDAEAGIQAGKAAGSVTVAIGDVAKARIADFNVDSFKQLLDIVF